MKNVNKTILVGILSLTIFGGCAKDIQSAMNNIKNENYSGLVGDVMNIGSSSMENGTIQKLLEKGSNTDGSKIDPKNVDSSLKDIEDNLATIQAASDQGNPKAQGLLAFYTEFKLKNISKATELYKKSCGGGIQFSCQRLSTNLQ